MHTFKKIAACIVLMGLMASSCTKKFEETNVDPNLIDQISPGTLLNPIIYNVSSFNMQRADDITFNLMQVALPYPSPSGGVHRYDMSENQGNSTWNNHYQWLNNVKEMYTASVKAKNGNYQGIAMVLNAWMYSNLTDCFGDIPMEEASHAEEDATFRPKFNTQKEVYTKILADLDSANKLFNTATPMPYASDILYANNVTKWKKFCNSLRLRLLLRVSKKAEMNAWAQIRTMVDNPTQYPVFASNAEAAILSISGVAPLMSPWARAIDFTTFRAVGKFFLDSLNALNDPRRPKFASQAKSIPGGTAIGYQGIPSGYTGSESQFNYTPSNVTAALVTAPMINIIMSYAEVQFIKAELEWRYGNAAAAKTAYEAGTKAAIEQWGLTMATDYFTSNPNAAYNGTLPRIMLQKYYALYFNDYQQWFEYRRTGLPVMPVADGMLNNKIMPVRFKYPINVRTLNPENYNKAAAACGNDDINFKSWWAQ